MIEDTFNRLRYAAKDNPTDLMSLMSAAKGVPTAQSAYAKGSGSVKAVREAEAYRDEVFSRLQAKYFPEDAIAGGERHVNRKQAHNWLIAQGYKVSRGKFYQDCKAGFPALGRDGSVSKFQTMQYGQQLDLASRGGDSMSFQDSEWDLLKTRAEAEIAQMKAERMRREEDSLWLHADEAWAQMAALIGTLRDSIRHHLYGGQREIVQEAGGDQERSQEVFDRIDQLISRAFNEVAAGEIHVEFERRMD